MEIICEDKQILQNRTRTYYCFDYTRYIEIMAAEHSKLAESIQAKTLDR